MLTAVLLSTTSAFYPSLVCFCPGFSVAGNKQKIKLANYQLPDIIGHYDQLLMWCHFANKLWFLYQLNLKEIILSVIMRGCAS